MRSSAIAAPERSRSGTSPRVRLSGERLQASARRARRAGALGLMFWMTSCAAAPAPPAKGRSHEPQACADSRGRVHAYVDAGRLESALAEIQRLAAEPCGPLDDALRGERDALRAELGDPPGDAAPPDVPGPGDTPARLRELVAEGTRLADAKDEAGSERAFARTRRLLERLGGSKLAFGRFSGTTCVAIGQGFALFEAVLPDGPRRLVVASLTADGAAQPIRLLEPTSQGVSSPRGTFVTLGPTASFYPGPEAAPVALGPTDAAYFSPSGAILIAIGKDNVDVRDAASGALREHFSSSIAGGAHGLTPRFFGDDALFVGALEPWSTLGGAVVVLDLAGRRLVASETGIASDVSASGRFVSIAAVRDPTRAVVTGTVWDTQHLDVAPWSVEVGDIGYVNMAGGVAFDTGETRLVYSVKDAALMGPLPEPIIRSAFDLGTHAPVKNPGSTVVASTPLEIWNATAPAYRPYGSTLIPSLDSPYVRLRTLSWSADRRTLALVEGVFEDRLVKDPSVLLVDAVTRRVLHRVALGTRAPIDVLSIRFGPGDYLAFGVGERGGGFIDRRTGELQRPPFDSPELATWSPDGRFAAVAATVRDLDAKRDYTLIDADGKTAEAWLQRPDERAIPEGIFCSAGDWMVPAEVCRSRLRLPR